MRQTSIQSDYSRSCNNTQKWQQNFKTSKGGRREEGKQSTVVLGPGPRHRETSARGIEHFKMYVNRKDFNISWTVFQTRQKTESEKTAVMFNSGPGEVGRAADDTASAGSGWGGYLWAVIYYREDVSPSETGWSWAPAQLKSSRQELNNCTLEAEDRLP